MQKTLLSTEQVLDGRYKILQHIADGGNGEVYVVENIFMHKKWAMKIINQHVVAPALIRRFQTEARLLAKLNHPNIVQAVDFGISGDDQPYFVMELLSGMTLSDSIKKHGALPASQAIDIVTSVCKALSYAHNLEIVHRDVKPGNIMLSEQTNNVLVKLLDFGIASFSDGERSKLTATGDVFGSPAYMSPEQCNAGKTDSRSDIYSLGCTFFEMLTGAPPFHGRTIMETMMMHISSQAPTLQDGALGKSFPPALEYIVKKMMAKSVSERYQHCDDVIADLQRLEKNNGFAAVEINVEPAQESSSRNKFLLQLTVTAVSITGLIGAVCWLFLHSTTVSSIEPKLQNSSRKNDHKSPALAELAAPVFTPVRATFASGGKFPVASVRDDSLDLDFGPSSVGMLSVNLGNGSIVERDACGRLSVPLGARLSLETSVAYLNKHPQSLKCFAPDRLAELSVLAPYDGVVWIDDSSSESSYLDKTLNEEAKNGIASLTGLNRLRLKSVVIGNQLKQLKLDKMTRLVDLDLRSTDISGNQLIEAINVEKLLTLRMENAAPCDLLIKNIGRFQNIHELQLIDSKLKDSDLKQIGELPRLTSLGIKNNAQITNAGLKNLLHLRYLRNIDLRKTQADPAASEILMRLPNLICLELTESETNTKEFWKSKFSPKYILQFKTDSL